MNEDLITTTEAAARLNVTPARVRQLVAAGRLPAQRFGAVNLVRAADLELVRNRPGVGRPPSKTATAATTKRTRKGAKG